MPRRHYIANKFNIYLSVAHIFCAKLFEFILSGFFQDYFLEDSLLYALSRIDEHFFWFRYNFALLST